MADDINKKITIDIEVNTDGQEQINQYKNSFDNLRNTLNALGNPINDISKELKSLDKNVSDLSKSLNNIKESGDLFSKVGDEVRNVASSALGSFLGLTEALKKLKISFGAFNAEITGGISLLIAFAPEILKFIGSFFKADTATKSLSQSLKEQKSILQAVTQARQQGDQNAQQELVNLKTLYSASQDQNLSLNERKKAVNDLQSQYPGYFGNLTSEAILAGKAVSAYATLTQSIIASSRAKAAEDMMVENSKRQITDKSKTDDLQQQIDAKKKELAETIDKYRTAYAKGGRGRGAAPGAEYLGQIREMRDGIIELQKTYNDAANDSTFFANIFCKSKKPLLFLPLQFNIK